MQSNLEGKEVTSIVSKGRGDPTQAEFHRAMVVLQTLQGLKSTFKSPWTKALQLPSSDIIYPELHLSSLIASLSGGIPLHSDPNIPINLSQTAAIQHMLSLAPKSRISLIQGPPGTGKTTVISLYVLSAIAAGCKGIWLIAQSNVAVKNIAEKLAKVGFMDWRLIVSKDFHFDW